MYKHYSPTAPPANCHTYPLLVGRPSHLPPSNANSAGATALYAEPDSVKSASVTVCCDSGVVSYRKVIASPRHPKTNGSSFVAPEDGSH